ncbi:MAG: PilW family protein [Proteobacteria bacterium]|nr:PilW family protein [Pseudomonadota bacterium]
MNGRKISHKRQSGFSLIELLIVTTIIAIVVIMSSDIFTTVLRQSGQETKVVGSQIDSIIGIGVLRSDIEHAGYGLPWKFQNTPSTTNYEAATTITAGTYNDLPPNLPRAFVTGNDTGYNGSDYLVIKSTVAGISDTAQRWTYIIKGSVPKSWDSAKLNLTSGSRVIVIKPKTDDSSQNELVMNSTTFFTQYNPTVFSTTSTSVFVPSKTSERFLIYGVDPDTDLRMPFNRADYYISRPTSNMPASCAQNTGILYKATVNHADGLLTEMPLIDCVADMQVVFGLDTNNDGVVDSQSNNISSLSAQQIRERVKEVRVYILAQEGQKDTSYTHLSSSITVGETDTSSPYFGLGSTFNLSTTIGTGWQNYRWKIHALAIKPKELYQ